VSEGNITLKVNVVREKWLEGRRSYIGGSDAAAILGESLWGCALSVWRDKRGVQVEEPPASRHIERGNRLEDVVAKFWAEEHGAHVTRWHTIRHPEAEFLGANIDRQILGDPRGRGILEIKIPSKYVWLRYRREGLPAQYIIQGQHYLMVTGWTWMAYAVFNADSFEFADEGRKPFEIERNDALIAAMRPKLEIFWAQVENGPEPEKLSASDPRCARCKYRMMCHEEATVTGAEGGESTFTDDPVIVAGIRQYAEFSAIEKAAGEEKNAARELVRGLVKHGKTRTPAGSVTLGAPSMRFSMEAVRKEEPELAKRLEATYKLPTKEPFFGIYPAKEK
jgi:putative phage-type endonuclease